MARRNRKPGYKYGLILNQEKYPVKVHEAELVRSLDKPTTFWLEARCGAGKSQSLVDHEDRRNRIEVMHRLLDGDATVLCRKCYPE